MVEAATLRSGYELKDSMGFADRIESMLRRAMSIPLTEEVDEEFMDVDTSVRNDAGKKQTRNDDDDEEEELLAEDDDVNVKVSKQKQSKKVNQEPGVAEVRFIGLTSISLEDGTRP